MAISDFIGRKPVWRNFKRLASYQRCSLIGADNEPVFFAVVNSWSLLCGEMLCFYIMGVSEALTLGRVKVCKTFREELSLWQRSPRPYEQS